MDAAKVLRGEMTMDDLAFQTPADGRIWGTRYPRPSAIAKVTGACDFGADPVLKLPEETLQLALVQAKVSHARILSIDTAEAEKMPCVFKVITSKDIKGKNRITGLITFPANKGDGWDRPILCEENVFQFGDAMAIVCADTLKNAQAAAKKVKVQLEEPPSYMSAPADYAPAALRARIEAACGCVTFLHYGATETGLGGGVVCSVHQDRHLRESHLLVEIVDPAGSETLVDGELREVVVTTLTRKGMPLHRYRPDRRSGET